MVATTFLQKALHLEAVPSEFIFHISLTGYVISDFATRLQSLFKSYGSFFEEQELFIFITFSWTNYKTCFYEKMPELFSGCFSLFSSHNAP